MFPILTDDFLNSFAKEFTDFFEKTPCSCGNGCKCKEPSCQEETINEEEMVALRRYDNWEVNDDGYTKSIALPCSKENITLHVLDGEKVIVDYEETNVSESPNSYETHTFSGSITFALPTDADESTLSARFQDNFLILSVNKFTVSDGKTSRKIDIK